ncbi:response regulator [Sphingobium indicum]|uniref:LuxR family transcriptional regulator n=2 Tax=Sphingobium indicum TaxID=332055 RepID=A0A1L5BPL2_SPHIB|nr:response regulator [Sphingobium indicum]APL94702.1 LuxR family transcriptional regulator [Sphingobium indicum B90A]KEY99969.1 LuxR family transcriptional regulator [Sphingomonas sp. BHC-A]NYI23155.1 DNA-binding response OmpR family regulator/DNA-binding CsgD family transcriptional regulator [Sphingobium indicum]RYM04447.1 response regulator [Sphingobium indicum]
MTAKILIVDDDPDSRDMLRRMVEGEGWDAILAASGEEALALAEGADLVLMDAVMPGMGGFDGCRRLKAEPATAHLPVIFMTGLTETADVLRGLEAGGVDYVTKPLVLEVLVARIAVHLGNARLARRALAALDHAGGRIMVADEAGGIKWATDQTRQFLEELGPAVTAQVESAMRTLAARSAPGQRSVVIPIDGGRLTVTARGENGAGEAMFHLSRTIEDGEIVDLQEAFGLTRREAEVLLWISRGKSNRDASEILNISARTVNKHLEQIFVKMGVENRAAAAAAATRVTLDASDQR